MKIPLIILLILLPASFFLFQSADATEGYLYEERINSFYRYDGETFRWTSTREFLIVDYSDLNINDSKFMEIEILNDSQRGQTETIIQPLKTTNFELKTILNDDDSPREYSWKIFLFREADPEMVKSTKLDNTIRSAFIGKGQRIFDIKSTSEFFSVNLQHFENQSINGNWEQFQVNTEISTKNFKNGRIEKSAVHLKKVDNNDEVVFDLNYEIQEKSQIQRYLNLLDQPAWKVPIQLGGIILLVYTYIRLQRLWVENDIRIIRGKGKIITIENDKDMKGSDGSLNEESTEHNVD